MTVLGTHTRSHRARKEHACALCPRPIEPGEIYLVGITLPGSGAYPIGGGDFEPVDWPFTSLKAHNACFDREMVGE